MHLGPLHSQTGKQSCHNAFENSQGNSTLFTQSAAFLLSASEGTRYQCLPPNPGPLCIEGAELVVLMCDGPWGYTQSCPMQPTKKAAYTLHPQIANQSPYSPLKLPAASKAPCFCIVALPDAFNHRQVHFCNVT